MRERERERERGDGIVKKISIFSIQTNIANLGCDASRVCRYVRESVCVCVREEKREKERE